MPLYSQKFSSYSPFISVLSIVYDPKPYRDGATIDPGWKRSADKKMVAYSTKI